jgi:hypothetical protein
VYLSLAGTPANGAKIVASATPFIWHIWHDEVFPGVYRYVRDFGILFFGTKSFMLRWIHRIFAPNTTFNFDLWNYGDQSPGTAVTLWEKWNGAHQLWDFVLGGFFYLGWFVR